LIAGIAAAPASGSAPPVSILTMAQMSTFSSSPDVAVLGPVMTGIHVLECTR
jgi:hypothetical protein